MSSKWMFLPFIGGGSAKKNEAGHHANATNAQNEPSNGEDRLQHRESAREFAKKGEEDIVRDYNAPITWWVVSTLFPLIAGTFGPMASAFNIMAVAIDWRLIVSSSSMESEGSKIQDPKWLIGTNAVSLAIAIIANLALLAQMGGRLRFNVASPVTIVGWFISGFVDIGLAAAAPSQLPLPPDPMAAYSQAYYYCIFAGALYVLLSIMLMMTAWGVWVGNFSSEFKLTLSQRSLMFQTMMFLGYVLAAGAVYSKIEGWVYLDACYYIIVTLFTIGFGDFSPMTHLGRSLYFPMSVGGIVFVGLIIANIRTLVLESASVKVSTRLVEMARYKALKTGNIEEGIVKIRGIVVRDTNAETELERRENEFNVMREIQDAAAHNNRLLALGLSLAAFCILWFIGAVAFWQAEKSVGGQNWSYFEALYFTYTAQLTIGYGDYEPQTNSGKPAFVFWALIALPTLTVLIGAIGDTTSDFVNWAFVWVGRHSRDMVTLMQKLKSNPDKTRDVLSLAKTETGFGHKHAFHDIAKLEDGKLIPCEVNEKLHDGLDKDIVENSYRPFVILQTAQRLLAHLDEEKPRKYTFEEWVWVLRLLGEDESTEEGHHRIGQPLEEGQETVTPVREHRQQVWSWMGQESPLMSLEDDSEPKWILKRLMMVLEKDVKARGDVRVNTMAEKATSDR